MGIKRWDKKEEAPFLVLFYFFVHDKLSQWTELKSCLAKTCGRRGCVPCKMIRVQTPCRHRNIELVCYQIPAAEVD